MLQNLIKKILCILLCSSSIFILGVPARVVIIRHGEKQTVAEAEALGEKNIPKGKSTYTIYLSVKGWERAFALVPFFTLNPDFTKFGKPVAIFASSPCKQDPSVRPIDTITPTAQAFDLQVNKNYSAPEYQKMVDYIMSNPEFHNQYIIICFEHKHIPPMITQAFGVKHAPTTWNNNVFDRAVVLELDIKTGKVINLQDLPQRLLFGDSAQ